MIIVCIKREATDREGVLIVDLARCLALETDSKIGDSQEEEALWVGCTGTHGCRRKYAASS